MHSASLIIRTVFVLILLAVSFIACQQKQLVPATPTQSLVFDAFQVQDSPSDRPPLQCSHATPPTVQAVISPVTKVNHPTKPVSKWFIEYQISGAGFEAGENLRIRVESNGPTQERVLEAKQIKVKPDGTFTYSADVYFDENNLTWRVYVVHKGGVACTSFFA